MGELDSHALAVIDRHLPILLDWPTPNSKEKDLGDHVAKGGVYSNVFDDSMLSRKADAMSCPSANGSSMRVLGPAKDNAKQGEGGSRHGRVQYQEACFGQPQGGQLKFFGDKDPFTAIDGIGDFCRGQSFENARRQVATQIFGRCVEAYYHDREAYLCS